MNSLPVSRHTQAKQLRAQGMKLGQIAEIMGISQNTVGAHLNYDPQFRASRRKESRNHLVKITLPLELREIAKGMSMGDTAFAQRLIDLLANERILIENLLDEGV
jgi:predicted transcriptional regulator